MSKTYRGKVRALRGIDMRVGRGEIFGLLGPNGAGKSTLVKILMTVIRPTTCAGHMLGEPVGRKETLRRVGYLPEHHRFPEYLTGAQVLDFYAALSAVGRRDRRARAAELLDLVGMTRWAGTRVRGYSKGMRQRIGIAQALMNDPELVLLDEPTDGVDPVGRRDIRMMTQELKRRGKTVLINSHLLSELEMVCDRVAILVQGQVASQGTIDSLTKHQERYEIEVAAEGATRLAGALAGMGEGTSRADGAGGPRLPTGEPVTVEGAVVRAATTEARRVQPLIDALRRADVEIRSMRAMRPSLEDLFMQAVHDPTTGGELLPGAKDGAR
ncbi:MAG: ABC transporter ATP-binding protein [Planctomycetota bacterium]|nr:ABC transporter ATP-binding protein [Planctomycetota bacterium]